MADKKRKTKTKRPARKRTTTRKRTAKKLAIAPPPSGPILDLTIAPDRPTVRLLAGDYKMRLAEELTFREFADQVAAGKALIEKAEEIDNDEVLAELQTLIAESAQALLVDLDDEAAASITPGMYQRISAFFNELARADGASASGSGSSSAPDASGSSERSAAV